MEFRRSSRLKMLPVVIGISIWASFSIPPSIIPPPPFFIISLYWVITSSTNYAKRFQIDDQRITMHGYIGGPISLSKEEVTSCTYTRVKGTGRGGFDMSFLEIRGSTGGIRIWRWGWGRRRKLLFDTLNKWLADTTGVVVDDRSKAMLTLFSNSPRG